MTSAPENFIRFFWKMMQSRRNKTLMLYKGSSAKIFRNPMESWMFNYTRRSWVCLQKLASPIVKKSKLRWGESFESSTWATKSLRISKKQQLGSLAVSKKLQFFSIATQEVWSSKKQCRVSSSRTQARRVSQTIRQNHDLI